MGMDAEDRILFIAVRRGIPAVRYFVWRLAMTRLPANEVVGKEYL